MEQSSAVERKIIDAAREVFVENGYDGAKMRDIAARQHQHIDASLLFTRRTTCST